MRSVCLTLMLVGALVTAVPDVLPGSNVTVPLNFGPLCQDRYLYPQGYALGAWHAQLCLVFFFSRPDLSSRQVRSLHAARGRQPNV